MAVQGYEKIRAGEFDQAPASETELTGEPFVRGVALALRAQWEGGDHFGLAATLTDQGADPCSDRGAGQGANPGNDADDWADYRNESEAAIMAYLALLKRSGFRIVRDPA